MKYIYIVGILAIMTSCGTSTKMITKSPTEVKLMSTAQFETNIDLVFKSVISLLQSESYIIERADKETGLINAYKRIENENANRQRFWTGKAKDANTSKAMFYIESINENITEVKITLYEGEETSRTGLFGAVNKKNNEQMVYEPQMYKEWFSSLLAEIERRKALLN